MLLAISEWIKNKNTEETREEKYKEEATPHSLTEVIKKLQGTEKERKIINDWKDKKIEVGKDNANNWKKEDYKQYDFIYNFVETFEISKLKNYGGLAKRFKILFKYESRELFEKNILLEFELINIIDQAICMKIIEFNVQIQKENKRVNGKMKIGMVYEGLFFKN